jgi:hypothetical protein
MTPVRLLAMMGAGRGDDMPTLRTSARKVPAKAKPAKRIVQTLNVNASGKAYPRDADTYEAARKAFLKALPKSGPGVTQPEMMDLMKQAPPAREWGTTQGR